MKCDGCGKEDVAAVKTEKEGKPVTLCPSCMDETNESSACRCKETVGKRPFEIVRMVIRDMLGRKK